MTTSENCTELWGALLEARKHFRPVVKDSLAQIGTGRSYSYADLSTLLDAVQPALLEQGVILLQAVNADTSCLLTRLIHAATGQYVEVPYPLNLEQMPQALGSAVTYARRYQLLALLGVAAEDDDGATAQAPTPEPRPRASASSDAPAGALETARVVVRDVRQKALTNGGTKFTIVASDGETYTSFKRDLAELAKIAKASGVEVELVFRRSKFGRDVVALHDLSQPEPPL